MDINQNQDNPYHAPVATIAESTPDEHLPIVPAGRWRRFFNLLIDYVGFSIFSLVIAIPYVAFQYHQGGDAALDSLEQDTNTMRDYAIGIISMLGYYVLMEGFFGFTLGKLITGTRVVNAQGGKPTWGQIIGRSLARLIPFEPFSLLFSIDDQRRGWHDSLPKTWVVRRR